MYPRDEGLDRFVVLRNGVEGYCNDETAELPGTGKDMEWKLYKLLNQLNLVPLDLTGNTW